MGYFSFERMITSSIVKAIYFLGFLLLTTLGLASIIWAGLRLHDANIARTLGWEYVGAGAPIVIVGNILWRLLCELWMVLFQINSQLAAHDINRGVRLQSMPKNQIVERRIAAVDRRPAKGLEGIKEPSEEETIRTQRPAASVLGLT